MSIRSFVPSSARRICGILVGLVLAPAAIGQTTITAPYNPDSDADSVIAILDLMSVLSIYGDVFEPAEILVDGGTLQEFIDALEESANCTVGCPDELACNYDSTATVGIACTCDYLSCVGCTDPSYLEYDHSATIDDGSCATLVVEGCTDETASNYNPSATSDDGSCDYSTSGCDPVTFDGYTYEVVEIGSQCWFAENLRTTVYANGDEIPGNQEGSDWYAASSGVQAIYGEGEASVYEGNEDELSNLQDYGRLYNWYAVDDPRGLCPQGWHLPTMGEWMELIDELGENFNPGHQMKSSPSDVPSWDGSNDSGFSGLPGGWRYDFDAYGLEGYLGTWWTASSDAASSAFSLALLTGYGDYELYDLDVHYGFSVRCLKDE